jgi:hypothetical protein
MPERQKGLFLKIMRVLVVEDNQILSRNLVKYLIKRDIFVEAAYD